MGVTLTLVAFYRATEMPKEKLPMRKIRDVLRYRYSVGLSLDAIARSLKLSKGVVAKYIRLFQEAGITWPIPEDLDDLSLEKKLFRKAGPPLPTYQEPDYARIHQELKRKGVTLLLLWEEYTQGAGDRAYQYTAFCTRYRDWSLTLKRSMRQAHRAGEKLFADYAGPTLPITDARTGEVQPGHIFVAVLGASNYTFACATVGQKQTDWLNGLERALHFIGGVPALIVPDNPKALVNKAHRYEPELNRTTTEFAQHYDTVILPARPKKPQDKAKVEVGVQVVERWVLARLRHRTFFSLQELDQAIADLLPPLNQKLFKKLPGCRQSAFESLDRPYLRALPTARFEVAEWKKAKVNIDYHVEFEGCYYSAPPALVRQDVDLRITAAVVEILVHNKRVASHGRGQVKGQFITLAGHMPAAHRAHAEWSPGKLMAWAKAIGPATGTLVETILTTRKHPEQGYRTSLGLMSLARQYGRPRLEAASARALRVGAHSYRSVKAILKAGLDRQPLPLRPTDSVMPEHANIRGADYYHSP